MDFYRSTTEMVRTLASYIECPHRIQRICEAEGSYPSLEMIERLRKQSTGARRKAPNDFHKSMRSQTDNEKMVEDGSRALLHRIQEARAA